MAIASAAAQGEIRPLEGRAAGGGAEGPCAIECRGLHKAFGKSKVLDGVDLRIPEGMITLVLGPSGTGKSVLINHLIGLMFPDAGDVLVHGESVPRMSMSELLEMRRRFGILFQDGALFGSMAVYDNVAFPLRAAHRPDRGRDTARSCCAAARSRSGRCRLPDAKPAVGRHAQARRVRACARAGARDRSSSTSPTRDSIQYAPRCCAS